MERKKLTNLLKISVVGLLAVSVGCKKDKSEKTQKELIQSKWYTKQIVTTTTNTSSGTTTSSTTNSNFSTTDFVTFDSNSKYSSSGSPLAGDYGDYAINSSSTLTLTSTKTAGSTSSYTITKLTTSDLTLETSATTNNTKIVVDIIMSK